MKEAMEEKQEMTEVAEAAVPVLAEAAEAPAAEEKADAEVAKLQADMADLRKESAVLYQLALMGAHNPKAAVRVLDMSGVAVEGDRVIGAEESVCRLMETDPYLFALRPAAMGGGTSTGAVHGEGPRDTEALSDSEYYAVVLKKQK